MHKFHMKKTRITDEARKITLSARERELLRNRLLSYMEYHPLRMPMPRRRTTTASYAQRLVASFGIRAAHLRSAAGALALLFFIAVPVAAERALPGDALYSVKVRVNENVRSQLTFSPYARVEWESERMERRIAEARALARAGNLTPERERAIAATVRTHTATFQQQLAELREHDAAGAALAEIALDSALDVQFVALASETERYATSTMLHSTSSSPVASLEEAVREMRAGSAAFDEHTAPSYERLRAHVEENMTRLRALLAVALHDDAQRGDVEQRIAQLEADIEAAHASYEAGEGREAALLMRDTLSATQKLVAFMGDIDLRSSISLDKLIPADSSRRVVREGLESALVVFSEKRTLLDASLVILPEAERNTFAETLAQLDEALERLRDALERRELDEAGEHARAADALVAELEAVLREPENESE